MAGINPLPGFENWIDDDDDEADETMDLEDPPNQEQPPKETEEVKFTVAMAENERQPPPETAPSPNSVAITTTFAEEERLSEEEEMGVHLPSTPISQRKRFPSGGDEWAVDQLQKKTGVASNEVAFVRKPKSADPAVPLVCV